MANKINKVFGTGGIGTGIFFKLHDDKTMTRSESRPGILTDYRDYCKAHIILHYIAEFTKSFAKSAEVKVFAVGMVGQDEAGESLKREMHEAKIDTRFVGVTDKKRTMYSVCFQYPDGTGGNITASNSACDLVTPEYIEECSKEIDENSLILAAPEVPLSSRMKLLENGKKRGAFTVSSFLVEEADAFKNAGGFILSDLISINTDEAEAVGGNISLTPKIISDENPAVKLIITAGADGSYIYENGNMTIIPCIKEKEIVSTAGAGDAYLGGTVAALIRGADFKSAAEYGAVAARFAVMSADTIAKEATLENVEKYMKLNHIKTGG